MLKLEKPIVFFDVETTGIDVNKDRIVQLAYIKLYPDGRKEQGNYLLNPEIHIPLEASNVHGITDEMVKDKPKFGDVVNELYEIFKDSDLAGYNSNVFDVPILLSEFHRHKKFLNTFEKNYVDVFNIERLVNKRTLSEVYKRYTGKELGNAHDALADVKATVEILEHQIKNFDLPTSPTELDKFTQQDNERVDLANKLVKHGGNICWNFGKHKYVPVKETLNYANWYLGLSIPYDTRRIIEREIKGAK